MKRLLMIAVTSLVLVTAASTESRAQTFITPFAGMTFGKDAPDEKFTTGASLTIMGAVAGVEFDFGYTPDFFNKSSDLVLIGDNNVVTATANLLIGVGAGPVRPYLVGGLGLIRSSVNNPDELFDDIRTNDVGVDAGGGIIGMLGDHVGLRADLRYFRTFNDPENDGNFDVALGSFDFWRGTAGISFKF